MLLSPLMPLREKGSAAAASLAAEFTAAATSLNSIITRERVASILTTHFPLKKQARSVFFIVAAIHGSQRGIFQSGELFAQSFVGGSAAFSKNSAGATFCIHHFGGGGGGGGKPRDTRAPKS